MRRFTRGFAVLLSVLQISFCLDLDVYAAGGRAAVSASKGASLAPVSVGGWLGPMQMGQPRIVPTITNPGVAAENVPAVAVGASAILPAHAAASLAHDGESGPGAILKVSDRVNEDLALPGLRPQAPEESARGAAERVFADIVHEKLISPASGEASSRNDAAASASPGRDAARQSGETEDELLDGLRALPKSAFDKHRGNGALRAGDTVVIVGGGYAGALAALNFKRANPSIKVAVIEKRSLESSAGGPATCKGCMGGIAATAVDHLAELGIDIPAHLVVGQADTMELRNLNDPDGAVAAPAPPAAHHKAVFIANGNGPAGMIHGSNISFTAFLRAEAVRLGVKFIAGAATNVFVPRDIAQKALVFYQASGAAAEKRTLVTADFVMNAAGVNGGKNLRVMRYHRSETGLDVEPIDTSVWTHAAGIFELQLSEAEIAALKLNPRSFYYWYGMKNTEAVLGMLKTHGDLHWMTIVIAPSPGLFNGNKDKTQTHKDLEKMYFDFLRLSKITQVIGERRPQCRCAPLIPSSLARQMIYHRYVAVGDASGVMKYKKNGIGYLIENANAIVEAALLDGVTASALKAATSRRFSRVRRDNILGKFIFAASRFINGLPFLSYVYEAVLRHSESVRQFASRLVLGNTEFATTYFGNMVKTAAHMLGMDKLVDKFTRRPRSRLPLEKVL